MRYFLLLAAPVLLLGAARPESQLSAPGLPRPASAAAPLAAPGAVLTNAVRNSLLARTNLGRLWQHQP